MGRALAKLTLNTDGTNCEDARSSNFARAWNSNIVTHNVQACTQFIAHKYSGSIRRSDVVFCKVEKANEDCFRGTTDFPAVVEWKNAFLEEPTGKELSTPS